jgi:hypothetical protein
VRSSQGVRKIVKPTQKKLIWIEFLFGGMQKGHNSDLGYSEGKTFDLGVAQIKKVENPCSTIFLNIKSFSEVVPY